MYTKVHIQYFTLKDNKDTRFLPIELPVKLIQFNKLCVSRYSPYSSVSTVIVFMTPLGSYAK